MEARGQWHVTTAVTHGASAHSRYNALHKLQVMVCGGGAWGRGSALLTADGKYVLVAVAYNIRLYSSASGEFVTSLNGHAADVTAVVLDHASDDKVQRSPSNGAHCLP